jgi:hypothetical protein
MMGMGQVDDFIGPQSTGKEQEPQQASKNQDSE